MPKIRVHELAKQLNIGNKDLMAKLNQGGVYFLDLAICADLYKNRMSFSELDVRRKQIETEEAAKRAQGRSR